MYVTDNMDKAFAQAGITANERSTKAYEKIKEAIKNNPEIIIGESLGDALNEAAKISKLLKSQTLQARSGIISDSDTRDAVAAFMAVLDGVKATFGSENMSETVICKAIEAGSYVAYRRIMGEAATVVSSKRY